MIAPRHYTSFPAETFGDEAPGVTIRWVIDERQGSKNYAMRIIEIAPGGHTPHHTHWFEHQNYVLEGQGEVVMNDHVHPIRSGDIIFIPGNMPHQYRNTGQAPLRFICSIPQPWLKDVQPPAE